MKLLCTMIAALLLAGCKPSGVPGPKAEATAPGEKTAADYRAEILRNNARFEKIRQEQLLLGAKVSNDLAQGIKFDEKGEGMRHVLFLMEQSIFTTSNNVQAYYQFRLAANPADLADEFPVIMAGERGWPVTNSSRTGLPWKQ